MSTNGFTKLAPLFGLFAQGTPILMYHQLGRQPLDARFKGYHVRAAIFARQLRELRRQGLHSVWPGETAVAGTAVSITFDDGYANVVAHGLRPLADNGFRAIQFIVAGEIGGWNRWDMRAGEIPARLMDAAQIRDWVAAGHAIGSHGLTHARLTTLPIAAAREEIVASKKRLEDLLGAAVEHFCYPHGECNPEVAEWVREAGYRSACGTDFGVNPAGCDPFTLKRLYIRDRDRYRRHWWRKLRGMMGMHRSAQPDSPTALSQP